MASELQPFVMCRKQIEQVPALELRLLGLNVSYGMHLLNTNTLVPNNGKMYLNEKFVSIHFNYDAKVIEYFEFGNVLGIYLLGMSGSSFPGVSIIYVFKQKRTIGCAEYFV